MHPQQCFLNQNKRTNQSIHIGFYQQLVVLPHLYRKMGRLATMTVGFLSLPRCVCVSVMVGEGGERAGGNIAISSYFSPVCLFIDRPLSYQLHSVGLSVSTFPSMYTSVELVVI
jgi:hypothetical protein